MARYELTEQQVQNLKAFIMDANIKGSAAYVVVELIAVLDNPVKKAREDDLHREHNDVEEHCTDPAGEKAVIKVTNVELLRVSDNPVAKVKDDDLHSEHNDVEEQGKDES